MLILKHFRIDEIASKVLEYLPRLEALFADEVTARLNANVLVVFRADLAQLKSGSDVAVELVLLLTDLNVNLVVVRLLELRVGRASIGIEVTVDRVDSC